MAPREVLSKPLDVEEFRRHAHEMVDFIADYHHGVHHFSVRSQVQPGYLKPLLPDAAPESPETLQDIISDIQTKIFPGLTHWQSPSFFGYYPANCSTAAFLGEMLSSGLNVVGFNWIASPAATELETIVLDWLGNLLELPQSFLSSGHGGGVIQGTASEAVLVVLLAARTRSIKKLVRQGISEAEALSKIVVYSSDQSHACVQKACKIAGICDGNIRVLRTEKSTNYSLSPGLFSTVVAKDVANGHVPFFLCGTVGTTSSAAVDSILDLGNIAKEHGMWFHVDAAYAGSACICPEFRHFLDGIDTADSVCINSHKWLLTNFDCSNLWVKDAAQLEAALSTSPEYLKNKATDEKLVVDYKDRQIPLGRRFRALKLWMVLRLYGASGLRAQIRKHVSLAKHFETLVHGNKKFEVVSPQAFSLVCFRLRPSTNELDNGNTVNRALLDSINSTGECFLTHAILSGLFVLRMAIGGTRTELVHVVDAWNVIQREAAILLDGIQLPFAHDHL